jgi:hypothetical protein
MSALAIQRIDRSCSPSVRILPFSGIGLLVTVWNQYPGQNGTPLRWPQITETLTEYQWKSQVFGASLNITRTDCLPNL